MFSFEVSITIITTIWSFLKLAQKAHLTYLRDYVGSLSRDISGNPTVNYQINATANKGESGALNGTFNICDYLEKMHQPPDSAEPEENCPPSEGPVRNCL